VHDRSSRRYPGLDPVASAHAVRYDLDMTDRTVGGYDIRGIAGRDPAEARRPGA
jgi:hypothetical protein